MIKLITFNYKSNVSVWFFNRFLLLLLLLISDFRSTVVSGFSGNP